MNETQIAKVIAKSKRLNSLLEGELAAKALGINVLSDSSDRKKFLVRLIASLEQYIAKEQHIIYVGFVGHFSSGKSSTINSLLELNNTSDERETDLNPTDTSISLITDKKNSQKLIHMVRENSLVPVRSTLIDYDFLHNLVIADTPGSGDPNVVNELIQDFLPICDYIFYFISAANPVDVADIPLLNQKFLKLPFLPLKFVITRTDEFRKNSLLPLADDNIDESKRDKFIGQLISRLKEFGSVGDVLIEDFLFIDNVQQFNINSLKENLYKWSLSSDTQVVLNNHGHKVEFFSNAMVEIESYFLSTIKNKINTTADFLNTASENVNKFDAVVELNNEKFRDLWINGDISFKRALQAEQDKLGSILNFSLLKNFEKDFSVLQQVKMINTVIEQQSNGNIGQFANILYQQIRAAVISFRQDFVKSINESNLILEDIRTIFPNSIKFDLLEDELEVDFTKMDSHVLEYVKLSYQLADQQRVSLLSKIEDFISVLKQKHVILTLEKLYQDGVETFDLNFEKYFDVIEMYKASVLTKNTKDTIEKLRVGKQLDELDDDFPDQYKQLKKQEAIASVYSKKETYTGDTKILINDLEMEANSLKREINGFKIEKLHTSPFFKREKFKVLEPLEQTNIEIQNNLNAVFQEKLLKAYESHRLKYLEFDKMRVKQKKSRFYAIIKWCGISAMIGLATVLIILKFNVSTETTFAWEVFYAILGTIVSGLGGFLYGMARNDLNTMTEKLSTAFTENSKLSFNAEFNDDFFNRLEQSISDSRQKKLPSLEDAFRNRVNFAKSVTDAEVKGVLNALMLINGRLSEIVSKYSNLIVEYQQVFSAVFSSPNANLDKITVLTTEIKQKSIAPSFALINNTKIELERVKEQIESVIS
ncbi:50S ribosome-binding GTPase [Sphingobacterium deserti]|uniref:Uncharacterized protein n=1 Tax=Sphingobacterium deserti TaxID=1229276 RepID=A0A0B8T7Q9_9SPHI|nr:50S ribosome-binding GTPase [Sphingobacterium deserti]KGE13800.1 hypothetical protein DI53_2426 [Sphingobacterium deserti]